MRDVLLDADVGLAELRRRLARWRKMHGGRGRRLPEDVWESAVRLARGRDPDTVARALRLNPESLLRRLALAGDGEAGSRRGPAAFVELAPVAEAAVSGGCRVELSGADGSRVSIHIADPRSVDLVALAGGLLRAGR